MNLTILYLVAALYTAAAALYGAACICLWLAIHPDPATAKDANLAEQLRQARQIIVVLIVALTVAILVGVIVITTQSRLCASKAELKAALDQHSTVIFRARAQVGCRVQLTVHSGINTTAPA